MLYIVCFFRPESGDPQRSLPFPGGSQFHLNWNPLCFPMSCRAPGFQHISQGVQVAGRIHKSGICRVAGQDHRTTSDDINYSNY